jgi:hypothetical protein
VRAPAAPTVAQPRRPLPALPSALPSQTDGRPTAHASTLFRARSQKYIPQKIQSSNLKRIEATSADNVLMAVDATVIWRITDVETAALNSVPSPRLHTRPSHAPLLARRSSRSAHTATQPHGRSVLCARAH